MLPETATLSELKVRASKICSMSYANVTVYSESSFVGTTDQKLSNLVPYFCFMSAYTLVLLEDGFGFTSNHSITVLDEVNGNKVGWTLGAILYEINTLPFDLEDVAEPWGNYFLSASIGIIIGSVATFFLSKELFFERQLKHRQPLQQQTHKPTSSFNAATNLGSLRHSTDNWTTQIAQYNPFDKHTYHAIPEPK